MSRPPIALETAFLTRGLPDAVALDTARRMAKTVRAAGATPMYIGVLDGEPIVGMDDDQLVALADRGGKLSTKDLPAAIARRESGGTTVAATLFLAHRAGIAVAATGGIGGVHAGGGTPDVSADLIELSRTPVALVCSGAKAILDLPATVEALETLGVSVVGYGTDEWPAFWSASSGITLAHRADSASDVASMWREHRALDLPGALLVCAPPPTDVALTASESADAVDAAIVQAEKADIGGADVTPFLLDAIVELTHGRSLEANVALLVENAQIGAGIAVEIGVA